MEHHHRTVNPALSSSSHSISTTGNNERSLFRSRLLPAFSYSARPSSFEQDNVLEVIDTFAPRLQSQSDLSPTSAASSSSRSSGASDFSFAHTASFSTSSASSAADLAASRVIRFFGLPDNAAFAEQVLSGVLKSRPTLPTPVTLWARTEEYNALDNKDAGSVFAIFRASEEARMFLHLASMSPTLTIGVSPAMESELEPFSGLRRVFQSSATPQRHLYTSASYPDLHLHSASNLGREIANVPESALGLEHKMSGMNISSNPPNPRTSFRMGDWICRSPKCGAHNFGRNLACIGCGGPRSVSQQQHQPHQHQNLTNPRPMPSPRFTASAPSPPIYLTGPTHTNISPALPSPLNTATVNGSYFAFQQQQQPQPALPLPPMLPSPQSIFGGMGTGDRGSHPLLTPSGRTFAVGGRVQNVSSDPLSPCIMYWPDNESFPEQGQIRPSTLTGLPQPPILNTGNRGPISHQPGDWICRKCNYLNWRRRKVCQTCLPYAEGNGDSISAAVQAERIALLTSVLSQTQLSAVPAPPSPVTATRSQSLTPPHPLLHRPFIDISRPNSRVTPVVQRSQSHIELGAQYAAAQPIYQTSGLSPQSYSQHGGQYQSQSGPRPLLVHAPAPAPLLPSFLQDIVQSPTLSPSSTSSADLSFEEYDVESSPRSTRSMLSRSRNNHIVSSANVEAELGNIWRLDGEESKSLSAFQLRNRQDLMGGSRKSSLERLK